jgi:hypothetical protein
MSARRFASPRALLVAADAECRPVCFVWRERTERVVVVEATWEEAEGWWRASDGAAGRRCYRVRTATGLRCLLYYRIDLRTWALGAILD